MAGRNSAGACGFAASISIRASAPASSSCAAPRGPARRSSNCTVRMSRTKVAVAKSRETQEVRRPHRYEWLWEPLDGDATFVLRSMFGAKAAYLDGKLMLCFCAGEEPWRGVLACTAREHHAALLAEFPE